MCGIAGIISSDGAPVLHKDIISMGRAIRHRGPDDEGFVFVRGDGGISAFSGDESRPEIKRQLPLLDSVGKQEGAKAAFTHRRFSIIDMSPGGHQPMADPANHFVLVFNGEIYNYIELRSELSGLGVKFKTRSDTEVVLAAYCQWGPDCFKRFNGFWSLAIYHTRSGRLVLVRDRLGKKPLYYAQAGRRFFFASEMKSLLKIKALSDTRSINEECAEVWLNFSCKDYDEQTFFKNILRVPPASILTFAGGAISSIDTWWSLPRQRYTQSQISLPEASVELHRRLKRAVKLRLRADVNVGSELSGGVDSSVLTALAAEYQPDIRVFTVRFPGKSFNEEPFARKVAEMYNLDYTVIEAPKMHIWQWIPQFTALEEEPYHSPNLISSQSIWVKMRRSGIKVSINGAAGDECFAGYYPHFLTMQNELFKSGRILNFIGNIIRYNQTPMYKTAINSVLRLARGINFRVNRKPPIFRSKGLLECPEYIFKSHATLAEHLRRDMKRTLMPYWLTSGDKATMGLPIEVRMPFLDVDVIDFAFKLPAAYFLRNGWHKWILRETFASKLPQDVIWRKLKMGFPFPLRQFIDENQKILNTISKQSDCPFFKLDSSTRYNWPAISFILWYEYYINANTGLFEKIQDLAGNGDRPEYCEG